MDLIVSLFFPVITLVVGWPVVAGWSLRPTEKLVALLTLSIVVVFLVGWAGYVWSWPPLLLWVLPGLSLLGVTFKARSFFALLRDREVRAMLMGQALVTAWCLGWLALVVNYSGGGWASDWLEHWQRAEFFVHRGAPTTLFLDLYSLTARPPLANVVTAVWLQLSSNDFAHFQLLTTAFATLVYLPCSLLVDRFALSRQASSGVRAVLVVLLMANPLFLQNATFSWTKLPTAVFVLTSLYFYLRSTDDDAPNGAATFAAIAAAAGILAHYSGLIYAAGLAVAWVGTSAVRSRSSFWRETIFGALAGSALLATWFAWALATFGLRGTFYSNTSVTEIDRAPAQQLLRILLNLRDTLIPHFLRPLDSTLIAQRNAWGYWRDWCFQLYQVNLWFAFGTMAAAAILFTAAKSLKSPRSATRRFWLTYLPTIVVGGIAVHGARDHWGLTHICLQPLVLLGLTYLASQWHLFSETLKRWLIAGGICDFVLGVVLHFGIENTAFERWGSASARLPGWASGYSETFSLNLRTKLHFHLTFIGDRYSGEVLLMLALLSAILTLALVRATRCGVPTE